MKQKQRLEGIQSNPGDFTLGEREELRQALFVALDRVEKLEQDLQQQQVLLHQVYSSSSWRLTAPLRGVVTFGRQLVHPRQLALAMVSRLAVAATRFPRLRSAMLAGLNHFPQLRESLRRAAMPSLVSNWSAPQLDYAESMTAEKLPPSGRLVYLSLLAEVKGQSPS